MCHALYAQVGGKVEWLVDKAPKGNEKNVPHSSILCEILCFS